MDDDFIYWDIGGRWEMSVRLKLWTICWQVKLVRTEITSAPYLRFTNFDLTLILLRAECKERLLRWWYVWLRMQILEDILSKTNDQFKTDWFPKDIQWIFFTSKYILKYKDHPMLQTFSHYRTQCIFLRRNSQRRRAGKRYSQFNDLSQLEHC